MTSPGLTRREFVRAGLLFSASLMAPRLASARTEEKDALHLFCFGDWGCRASTNQTQVARALRDYAGSRQLTPDALLLLGDNFYGHLDGVNSQRWKVEFEDMYPASVFPGRCFAVLGNHDYDDQPGGGQAFQLAYARTPGTRWTMPSLWYRVDFPAKNPVTTLLCTNTHYSKLSSQQIAEQQAWLEAELSSPKNGRWLLVCGHHPVLSCATAHTIDPRLVPWRELFDRRKVHAYLSGHEHDLQHLRDRSLFTDWFVSGGGGQGLHPADANAQTRFAKVSLGFLHLAIGKDKLQAAFVGPDAEVLYRFERGRA